MELAHFREIHFRMPDPLRPGQYTMGRRIEKSGMQAISHEGVTYEADDYGWFDLPDHVANYWHSRPGWLSPNEVEEEQRLGAVASNDAPVVRKPRATSKR